MNDDVASVRAMRFQKAEWALAALVTIGIVWLHIYFSFHSGGLWRDEVNTVNLSQSSSVADMARDSFPALLPIIIRCWSFVGFGAGDLSLRIFGALIGISLVVAFWANAWTVRKTPPLIGLLLMGVNSIAITYTDSIRAYGLGSCLIVFTMAAIWHLLRQPNWPRTILAASTAILSAQALYQNTVFIGAICIGAWIVCWRRKQWNAALKILLVGLAAALSLIPYWNLIAGLPDSMVGIRRTLDFQQAYTNLDTATGFPIGQYLYVWEFLVAVVIIVGLIAMLPSNSVTKKTSGKVGQNEIQDIYVFAGCTLFIGLVGFFGFSWLASMTIRIWYFIPLMAFVAACFDLGRPPLPLRFQSIPFGFATATAFVALPIAQHDLNWRFTNIDLIARRLNIESAKDDLIIITPWFCGISFDRYYQGSATWQTLPPLADHSLHRFDLVREQMKRTLVAIPVIEQIKHSLENGHNIWYASLWQIDLPPSGQPLPADLPPAPSLPSGWADSPYRHTWESQVLQAISNYSTNFVPVYKIKFDGFNMDENLFLYTASGWRTNQPATNR